MKSKSKKGLLAAAVLGIVCIVIAAAAAVLLRTKEPENITFAVLPDTQLYSESMPQIYDAQTKWIADNAKQENIRFVLHVGDIVNNAFNMEHWENSLAAMKTLEDAGIPYAVVTGNHDVDYKAAGMEMEEYYDDIRREGENFLVYYPEEKFQEMETYGGHSENGYNQYHFVKCGDYTILVLALDWLPSQETLEWARKLLAEYSNMPTIVLKHDFIKPRAGTTEDPELPVLSCEETEKQWEIFREYDQIFMILNGHYSGIDHGILENAHGNDVFVAVADFQSDRRGGNGMMQLLDLNFEGGCIEVETFSPYIMQLPESERHENDVEYLEGPNAAFEQEFDLLGRFEEIGRQ